MKIPFTALLVFLFVYPLPAQVLKPAPALPPDSRLKADILLVVAHPDDETGVSAYLAKLLDQHKRIEVVYLTHGEAGHNNMGPERGPSLGAVRETEVRHSLTSLGIDNVWFLDGRDTPSQNVLQSLANWHNGQALEEVVRMVRLTRPEVIVTWLPGFFIGENHGDHQASGVLSSEAFDIAGDPAVFPAQLAAATKINETLLEGLQPWQPKKIYYFSDAQEQDQFKGSGPTYTTTEISPAHNLPYWRLAMDAFSFHMTQYRDYIEGLSKKTPEQQKNEWGDPVDLIFGKSLVGGSRAGDVFEGIAPAPIPFARAIPSGEPPAHASLELAGPWGFYDVFRREHGLTQLPKAAVPEIAINHGQILQIPLLVRNNSSALQTITLTVTAPQTWTVQDFASSFSLAAGESSPVLVQVATPATDSNAADVKCRVENNHQTIGEVDLHVKLRAGGLPQ
ncbi:MAG TPA: PIG-L family deacetylase [Terriglobales bacterium]|nr:PIG-L family deacetylase [Terriglobales bacterium]